MPLIHAQTPRVNALAGGRFRLAAKAAVQKLPQQRPPSTNTRPGDHGVKQQKLFTGLFAILLLVFRIFLYQRKLWPEAGYSFIKIIYIAVCTIAHSIAWGAWGQWLPGTKGAKPNFIETLRDTGV